MAIFYQELSVELKVTSKLEATVDLQRLYAAISGFLHF